MIYRRLEIPTWLLSFSVWKMQIHSLVIHNSQWSSSLGQCDTAASCLFCNNNHMWTLLCSYLLSSLYHHCWGQVRYMQHWHRQHMAVLGKDKDGTITLLCTPSASGRTGGGRTDAGTWLNPGCSLGPSPLCGPHTRHLPETELLYLGVSICASAWWSLC